MLIFGRGPISEGLGGLGVLAVQLAILGVKLAIKLGILAWKAAPFVYRSITQPRIDYLFRRDKFKDLKPEHIVGAAFWVLASGIGASVWWHDYSTEKLYNQFRTDKPIVTKYQNAITRAFGNAFSVIGLPTGASHRANELMEQFKKDTALYNAQYIQNGKDAYATFIPGAITEAGSLNLNSCLKNIPTPNDYKSSDKGSPFRSHESVRSGDQYVTESPNVKSIETIGPAVVVGQGQSPDVLAAVVLFNLNFPKKGEAEQPNQYSDILFCKAYIDASQFTPDKGEEAAYTAFRKNPLRPAYKNLVGTTKPVKPVMP